MNLRHSIVGAVLAGASLVGVASMASSVAHAETPIATDGETSATAPPRPIEPPSQHMIVSPADVALLQELVAQLARFEANPGTVGPEAIATLRAHVEQVNVQLMAAVSSDFEAWADYLSQLEAWARSSSLDAAR